MTTHGNFLRQRASVIASELNLADFKESNHRLMSFKKRFNLTVAKAFGVPSSTDRNQLLTWLDENREKLLEYEPADTSNADATGLLYRLLPNRTLCFKKSKCHGGSQNKERLSILLCVNMTGEGKLTPLLERSRCFPKLRKSRSFYSPDQFGCEYRHRRNSWMNSAIFSE